MNALDAKPNRYYWATNINNDLGWVIIYLHHKMNGRMVKEFGSDVWDYDITKWAHLVEIEEPK